MADNKGKPMKFDNAPVQPVEQKGSVSLHSQFLQRLRKSSDEQVQEEKLHKSE